ncbi:PREDICTED: cytochrome c oxidase subunit NDUFA4-like [Priapulus caudatus]|uniref:Cytochrome c oxidase subunit NDUFA4-like n=1 Tax=Priapulus caudatus TaxID=37621 RepID=A0ABM1FBJ4_PRICU|nr:PREDICTED: cytochrome c oxidase subunit NDUFA4-like [Priapulus caudatus]
MKGLTMKSLRNHPSLMPLFASVGFGCILAGAYLYRLAVKSPEVSWDRKNNPYPWEKINARYQYKFFKTREYEKEENPRPEY